MFLFKPFGFAEGFFVFKGTLITQVAYDYL
jgi:hypothetical protein